MQIETLRDVLQWTTKFHQHLSECLAHCADENDSRRAKLLLDYLSQHEDCLADLLDQFEQTANTNALNTWCYEYLRKNPIVQHKHCDLPFSELDTRHIMEVIIDQHNQVIELYRQLSDHFESTSAHNLIMDLLALEEHEAMRMTQGANRLEDI